MLMVSLDGRGDVETFLNLGDLADRLNREMLFINSSASGIERARTYAFRVLKDGLKKLGDESPENKWKKLSVKAPEKVRGFWVDSDIRLETDAMVLKQEIEDADRENYSFSVAYPQLSMSDIIVSENDVERVLMPGEVKNMPNRSKILASGLGFYYGDLYLDYTFRFTGYGEDVNYFLDNKIDLRLVNSVEVSHVKPMRLTLNGVMFA